MMRLLSLALLATLSSPAHAQDATLRYATMPDLATAQALSAAAFAAVDCSPITMPGNCDPNRATKMNYPIIGLTDGRYAIVIHTGDVFQGEHIRVGGKSFDLPADQIALLATRAAMSTKLPDILSNAAFKARFSAAKKTAIVNFLSAHPGAAQTVWNRIIAGGDVDLQDATVQQLVAALRAGGVLSDADVAAALVPQVIP